MKKTVLITGAHGFIGRNIAYRYKQAGCFVAGIGHGDWDINEWKIWGLDSWQQESINLESLCKYAKQPDLIIHCAGSGSVAFSLREPYIDFKKTVCSTNAVLEYIRQYSPKTRLVYPSSAAVYGNVEKQPIKENTPLLPISPYGVHKKFAEELCAMYSEHYGMEIIVLRLFSVYGKGLKKQLLWDACNKIENHQGVFWGTGQEKRDWLHIRDVVELFYLAGNNKTNVRFMIFNAGSGKSISVRILLEMLVSFLGKTSFEINFNNKLDMGNPEKYQADNKLISSWGWLPKIRIEEGIEEYVKWYKNV